MLPIDKFHSRFREKIAEESEYGNIINACYNPEFAKQVKTRLLPYLPVWTGIMRPYFKRSGKIATSSSVEAEFADLKKRSFKDELPMRVDKFVIKHLDFLDTKIILASNNNDITNNTSSISNKQNVIHDNYNNSNDYNNLKENNSSNLSVSLSTNTVCLNEEQRSEDDHNKTCESLVPNLSDTTTNKSFRQYEFSKPE